MSEVTVGRAYLLFLRQVEWIDKNAEYYGVSKSDLVRELIDIGIEAKEDEAAEERYKIVGSTITYREDPNEPTDADREEYLKEHKEAKK